MMGTGKRLLGKYFRVAFFGQVITVYNTHLKAAFHIYDRQLSLRLSQSSDHTKTGHTNVCILSDRSIKWKPGHTNVCILSDRSILIIETWPYKCLYSIRSLDLNYGNLAIHVCILHDGLIALDVISATERSLTIIWKPAIHLNYFLRM